jgi:hypothetical protein
MILDCRLNPQHRHAQVFDAETGIALAGVFYADDERGSVGRVLINEMGQVVMRMIPVGPGQALNAGPEVIWETRPIRIEFSTDPALTTNLILPTPILN